LVGYFPPGLHTCQPRSAPNRPTRTSRWSTICCSACPSETWARPNRPGPDPKRSPARASASPPCSILGGSANDPSSRMVHMIVPGWRHNRSKPAPAEAGGYARGLRPLQTRFSPYRCAVPVPPVSGGFFPRRGLAAAHAAGRLVLFFFGRASTGRRGREAVRRRTSRRPSGRKNWFVYAKPPLRRARKRGSAYRAPRQKNPPRRHRETGRAGSPSTKRGVDLPLQGTTTRTTTKGLPAKNRQARYRTMTPRARRVHQALPAPRSAEGVPSHPATTDCLRQRHPARPTSRARRPTELIRRASGSDRSAGTTRRGNLDASRRSRPSPAYALLAAAA